jgi:glycosyltransferase involved in cell wall biosynthesis
MTVQPKHILIITREIVPFHYGGIGTQFKSLAGFLRRQGHQVYFLSRRPEYFDESIFKSHYGETQLFFVDIPPIQKDSFQHFYYAAEVARRFDEIYQDVHPDLVIIADYNAEGLFILLRSREDIYNGTEFLLTINGMNREIISVYEGNTHKTLYSNMDIPEIRLLIAMEDLCAHLAPKIISPTVSAWEEIRQRLNIHKAVRIIPNMTDLNMFHPEKNENPEESGDPLILFVGRLDRMKGADLLLKACLNIADRMQPYVPRVIFIGRDCYWKEYGSTFLEYWKKRIPEKYSSRISFLGQIDHSSIKSYYKKATVAVFPSRWEPFGIVCLESLSMGCPVIVPKETGFEEVLGQDLAQFAIPIKEDNLIMEQRILEFLQGKISFSTEKLRQRACEVVHQAEECWIDIIESNNRTNDGSDNKPLYDSFYQLLSGLENCLNGVSFLQIYFCRQGRYSETDSLRISYSMNRWNKLNIPLPKGTGDPYLRLDPIDHPGDVFIREIVLCDKEGNELWRSDKHSSFKEATCRDSVKMTRKNDLLILNAEDNDPQIFLNCPCITEASSLSITLFSRPIN